MIETTPVRRVLRYLGIATIFAGLTLLTQIGGLAYLLGLAAGVTPALRASRPWLRRTAMLGVAVASYILMTVWLVPPLAQSAGRVRLPCGTNSEGSVVAATWLTCALNRGYVRPEVLTVVLVLGNEIGRQFPGSQVTALEANFPFVDGFPLLPHLSHRDGRKVDLAYFYRSAGTNAPGLSVLARIFHLRAATRWRPVALRGSLDAAALEFRVVAAATAKLAPR